MYQVNAAVLAGGRGTRLSPITDSLPKPLVPIGKRTLVDFAISNALHSTVRKIFILEQTYARQIIRYIDQTYIAHGWGGRVFNEVASHETGKEIYEGTADAIRKFLEFRLHKTTNNNHLLVLSGDHLYTMDFDPLMDFHNSHQNPITAVVQKVPIKKAAKKLGVFEVNEQGKPVSIHEKLESPPTINRTDTCFANLGIYMFHINTLRELLSENLGHDFAKDTLPHAFNKGIDVSLYEYNDYWEDVGTIEGLWAATLALLGPNPAINLYDKHRPIYHRTMHLGPPKIHSGSTTDDIMPSDGCFFYQNSFTQSSVFSRGVKVFPDAHIVESIAHYNAQIHAARLKKVIICEQATINDGVILGENPEEEKRVYQKQGVFFDESGIIVVPAFANIKKPE